MRLDELSKFQMQQRRLHTVVRNAYVPVIVDVLVVV